ncbi:hypothetical protein AGMMS49938_17380 [Fibrobacterales bacterium]|nr:hypothetical protein AGMMS49938_17380 [Fibrobacterales bacterium]
MKRNLKIHCYGRYVDDMLLVHSEKSVLLSCIDEIRKFLSENLWLTLHPKKIKLQLASKGFSFLGAYIKPFKAHLGRRSIGNFRDCVLQPLPNRQKQAQRVQSYIGLLGV